ncbi:MAG: hypothetical protein ACXVYV_09615, partial [Gaiellales bacterium]
AVQQRLALRLEPAELRRLGAQLTSQEARVALVRRALPAQPPTRPKRDQERVTAYDFLGVVGDVAFVDDDDAGFLDLAMRRLEKHPGTPYTTIVAGMWGDAAAGYPGIAREILFGRSNTAHVLASQRHWALPQVLSNLALTADEARAVLRDLNYAPAGEMTSDVVDTVVALRLPETRLVLRLLAALPHDDPCRRRYEKVLAAACASCPEVTRSRISTHLGAGHKMEGIDPLTASVAELFEWLIGNRLRSDQVLSLRTRTDVDGETAWLAVEASRLVEAVNGTTESRAAAMIDVRPRDEEFVRRVLAHLPNAATRVSRPVKREVLVQALRERLAALTDPAVARHDDYRVTGLSHNLSPLVGADGVWQLPLLPLLAWARHDDLVGRWVGERLQNMFETSDRLALFEKVVGRVNESSSTAPAADLLDVVVAAYA